MGGIIMIQFNLKEYLKNPKRKVVTRDGRDVKIIRIDKKGYYPVMGLLNSNFKEWHTYTKDGKQVIGEDSDADLFFFSEKHEGWINLLRSSCGEVFIATNHPYKDEKTAKWEVSDRSDVVATCKITWEE